MGFLKRLFGGAAAAGREVPLNVTYFTAIRDDAVLEVVGEAYRQEGVYSARPPGPHDLPPGLPPPPVGQFKAMLIPEPSNEYDANAIAVHLWSGESWTMVGYLAREVALGFAPLLAYLDQKASDGPGTTRRAIACDATRVSERGGLGVVLHLGSPGECIVESITDEALAPRSDHAYRGKVVAFTGERGTTIHGVPLDRHAQLRLARWAGSDTVPRVTKRIDALVVSDREQSTANLQKAREYQIPVVDEVEYLREIGIPAELLGKVTGRWIAAASR